jgi:diguanylate cyclase (GGDEF)-like protein
VLLVEDDAATAELMTHYLTQGGYRVAHAFNGEAVVKQVRELCPFAVILDIMLPGKDGWQILQELKSDTRIKDIPVIIMSIIDNQSLGFALGATDYLIKPVNRTTLFEKLKELNFSKNKGRRPVNILCIDDNEGVRELLREILEPEGYNILTAGTGKEGIEKALVYRPDLIILDLMIPDMDGFELSRVLKNNAATVDIPIIILTAKDITIEERLKLVGNIESMMQKSYFTKEDLLSHIRDLEITYPVRAGLLDKVSGLFDKSYFQIRLAQEICRADRYHTIFAILMADIDGFSEYAKVNGMNNGNICIRKIADFLRKTTRGSDSLVRYGIDEFAILLSSATEEASRIVARRLLSFIESYHFPKVEQLKKMKLTASIAVVHYNRIGSSAPEQMISKAQELIREAKKNGGGKILIYGQNMYTGEDIDR